MLESCSLWGGIQVAPTFGGTKNCVWLMCSLLAICGAPRASAQSQFFCWVAETPQSNPYAEEGHPAYFTALINARDKDQLGRGLFAQYVEKKYSVVHHGQPYCTQLTQCPQGCQSLGSGFTNLQDRIGWVKQHGGTAIMTGWTPDKHTALMAEAAKNPAPAPPAAAAEKKAPPPSPTTQAYEKAMKAQRPQSVTDAQLAAAAKTPTPARPSDAPAVRAATTPTAAEKYQFCYTTGNPSHGAGQSHYYVTQVFPVAGPDPHRGNAFEAYLRGQYRQDSITGSSCSTPGPVSAEESTRRSYIENQSKIPNRAVVELNWKPAS